MRTSVKRRKAAQRSIALAALCLCAVAPGCVAQSYPTKPVRLIVPSSPGGGTDIVGRVRRAEAFASRWGSRLIVENRAGAGNDDRERDRRERARPDGYTLLMGISTLATIPAVVQDRALRCICMTSRRSRRRSRVPNVLVVHPSVPARNVKALIALGRAPPAGTRSRARPGPAPIRTCRSSSSGPWPVSRSCTCLIKAPVQAIDRTRSAAKSPLMFASVPTAHAAPQSRDACERSALRRRSAPKRCPDMPTIARSRSSWLRSDAVVRCARACRHAARRSSIACISEITVGAAHRRMLSSISPAKARNIVASTPGAIRRVSASRKRRNGRAWSRPPVSSRRWNRDHRRGAGDSASRPGVE